MCLGRAEACVSSYGVMVPARVRVVHMIGYFMASLICVMVAKQNTYLVVIQRSSTWEGVHSWSSKVLEIYMYNCKSGHYYEQYEVYNTFDLLEHVFLKAYYAVAGYQHRRLPSYRRSS
jgi:hypothetical protein